MRVEELHAGDRLLTVSDTASRVTELPFNSDRKRMTTHRWVLFFAILYGK